MQEQHLFEYAVIRVVPRVEREEFLNAGVILYCSRKKFLQVRWKLKAGRFQAFAGIDMDAVEQNLKSLECICNGGQDSGPIGKLVIAERFRWITASRSTVLQASKVHPGLCADPIKTLERLFEQLVL